MSFFLLSDGHEIETRSWRGDEGAITYAGKYIVETCTDWLTSSDYERVADRVEALHEVALREAKESTRYDVWAHYEGEKMNAHGVGAWYDLYGSTGQLQESADGNYVTAMVACCIEVGFCGADWGDEEWAVEFRHDVARKYMASAVSLNRQASAETGKPVFADLTVLYARLGAMMLIYKPPGAKYALKTSSCSDSVLKMWKTAADHGDGYGAIQAGTLLVQRFRGDAACGPATGRGSYEAPPPGNAEDIAAAAAYYKIALRYGDLAFPGESRSSAPTVAAYAAEALEALPAIAAGEGRGSTASVLVLAALAALTALVFFSALSAVQRVPPQTATSWMDDHPRTPPKKSPRSTSTSPKRKQSKKVPTGKKRAAAKGL